MRARPRITARWSSAARPVANDRPTSSGSASGCAPSQSRSRAACARSAGSDRADNTQGTGPPGTGAVTEVTGPAGLSSACSRITCALVPLIPNDDTPARRARPVAGQGRWAVSSSTPPAAQSTCGVGSSTCSVRGNTPCRNANTILITPATPAAAWVCPMFDFTDPNHNGRSGARSRP
ncbi:hypothetical protein EHYA_10414 [Embleya hyalina]|uniref:Uncharacterized protein n=1 Tax=Embleya hyalina TaxID=516124 RepID=A0A401Z746_9ACTN|nr:hypothetical protein EHYA_10414 [Embleya hyalina]